MFYCSDYLIRFLSRPHCPVAALPQRSCYAASCPKLWDARGPLVAGYINACFEATHYQHPCNIQSLNQSRWSSL